LTYPRGTAFHEAGHGIVAWSFGLDVKSIRVSLDEASGSTDTSHPDHLSLVEQIAIHMAGIESEKLFEAPAHWWAFGSDFQEIQNLLATHEITNGEGPVLREQGRALARARLELHRTKVIGLAQLLVERGSIDASAFRTFIDRPCAGGSTEL
jgi:Peptidase M50B-like